jgi:hypothetical protein
MTRVSLIPHAFLFAVALALACAAPTVAASGDPINDTCPVSKEVLDASAVIVEHDGHSIGLCCTSCVRTFERWNDRRRNAYVKRVLGDEAGGTTEQEAAPPATAAGKGIPYPLTTCVVMDSKLGSMGDPVVKVYDGREVKFCCAGCIGKFEGDKKKYFKKLDERIIKDQMRFYPLDTCVMTGEPLSEDGMDIATDVVHAGRLLRVCCRECAQAVAADPAPYIAKLDVAVAKAQRKDYPLDTCIVAGSKLGSMGEPAEFVVASRLFRTCCAACDPKVKNNPAKYLPTIDAAWAAKGRFDGKRR